MSTIRIVRYPGGKIKVGAEAVHSGKISKYLKIRVNNNNMSVASRDGEREIPPYSLDCLSLLKIL